MLENVVSTAGWADELRVWWTVSGMLVLLMQLGFIYLEMGCVRPEDRAGIAVKNVAMLLSSTLAYLLVGFRLMYGDSVGGVFGWEGDPSSHTGVHQAFEWVFLQVGFAAVAATIVSGALAGRTTLISNLVIAGLIGGLVFPLYGHWVWGTGFLSEDVHDFAGSGAVHFLGGMVALVAARIAGPRKYRTTDAGEELRDMPTATVGVVLLWIGWIGFNGGSVTPELLIKKQGFAPVGHAVIATTIAACAGGFVGIVVVGLREWFFGRGEGQPLRSCFRQEILFDPWAMLGGTMAGMVAITANCDWVENQYGVAAGIGALGAVAGFFVGRLVVRLGIDDPVEAISVHAGGGAAGMLVASFDESTLWMQIVALLMAVLLTVFVTTPVCAWLNKLKALRVSRVREEFGLAFRPIEFGQAVEALDSTFLWTTDSGESLVDPALRVRVVGQGEQRDELRAFLENHVALVDDSADAQVQILVPRDPDELAELVKALGNRRNRAIVLAGDVSHYRAHFDGSIIKFALGWRLRFVEALIALRTGNPSVEHAAFEESRSPGLSFPHPFLKAIASGILASLIVQLMQGKNPFAFLFDEARAGGGETSEPESIARASTWRFSSRPDAWKDSGDPPISAVVTLDRDRRTWALGIPVNVGDERDPYFVFERRAGGSAVVTTATSHRWNLYDLDSGLELALDCDFLKPRASEDDREPGVSDQPPEPVEPEPSPGEQEPNLPIEVLLHDRVDGIDSIGELWKSWKKTDEAAEILSRAQVEATRRRIAPSASAGPS